MRKNESGKFTKLPGIKWRNGYVIMIAAGYLFRGAFLVLVMVFKTLFVALAIVPMLIIIPLDEMLTPGNGQKDLDAIAEILRLR